MWCTSPHSEHLILETTRERVRSPINTTVSLKSALSAFINALQLCGILKLTDEFELQIALSFELN